MPKKTYKQLLKECPPQDSQAFLDFLRENNHVVWENKNWLVIENTKYHRTKAPWYTAFWKNSNPLIIDWWADACDLWPEFQDYKWIKKSKSKQTVRKRFHLHLIRE